MAEVKAKAQVNAKAAEAADKGTIGIAMPTKSSARWIADGDNMVKVLQAAGYKTDLPIARQRKKMDNGAAAPKGFSAPQPELFRLIIEGVLSIQSGANPRLLDDMLRSSLPPKERAAAEERKSA